MNTVKINTDCGEILGIAEEKFYEFRGIRYAEAKRFEYPAMITEWGGVYDATEFGACSLQRRAYEEDEKCNAFYHKEFRKGLSFTYSEDSLFLNIKTPKEAHDCPVVIYIHGGSFTGGSADEGHIKGNRFAENGVVYVGINYRLGPFGFCSHPDLRDSMGRCGNFGLYDQLTAIKWVRKNISAFGGNPNRITLMGQSAGAMSVDILMSSPECVNLISGAIMMSGAGIQRLAAKPLKPEKTKKFWDTIINNAGVGSIRELKKVDAKTLFYAWSDACDSDKLSMLHTLPVVDGRIITSGSFNKRTVPQIPMIIGVTVTDMIPAVMEVLTKKYVSASEKCGAKCYVYNFNRNLPGDSNGAWHSADILYAFGTLDFNWRPFEDIDRKISQQMVESFSAFVRSGDPNCDSIPQWNTGAAIPMRFCEHTAPIPWDTKNMIKNTFSNKGAEF